MSSQLLNSSLTFYIGLTVLLQLISISSCQSPDISFIKQILQEILGEPVSGFSEPQFDIEVRELMTGTGLSTGTESYSDECTTPTGQRGQCLNIRQCPSVISILQNAPRPLPRSTREMLAALRCGFDGRDPVVCCSMNSYFERNTTRLMPDQPDRPDPAQPEYYYSQAPPAVEGHPNLGLLPVDCGVILYEGRGFVHGGNKTSPYEFPWMALLSYETPSGQEFKCGGTVINERYILTAAHCITNLRGHNVLSGVRLGEHDITKEIDCADCSPPQDYSIEEVVPHPDYVGSRPRQGSRFQHDIGLIRLASPFDLSQKNVKSICLPHLKIHREKSLETGGLVVAGWGVTEEGNSSPDLLQVTLPYVPNDQCGSTFNRTIGDGIGFRQLCAGGVEGIDACGGDSGGPLQAAEYFNERSSYVQYGIVSFGPRTCGQLGIPGVYTRVSHYVKWILDTIKP